MIKRYLHDTIESKLYGGKAIILLGARQVGKATLLHTLFNNSEDTLWLNGDEADVLMGNYTLTNLNGTQNPRHCSLKHFQMHILTANLK
jgi:predicted AAA+ superfamily ATPase